MSEYELIGVSGGCDSMALLDMLRHQGKQLVVCHVNYQLRQDTHLDYEVVSNYCNQYNIPLEYLKVDKHCYGKGNFQTIARNIRYDFYFQIYSKYKADKLYLAHHQDDVLETIYMHKIRHSFPEYLGIQEKAYLYGMNVYRPLLNYRKKDLYAYCHNHHIKYHEDSTNFETHFTRDHIRNIEMKKLSEEEKQDLLLYAANYNKEKKKHKVLINRYLEIYKQNDKIDLRLIEDDIMNEFLYYLLKLYLKPQKISSHLIEEIQKQIRMQSNISMPLSVNYVFTKAYYDLRVHRKEEFQDYEYVIDNLKTLETPYFRIAIQGHINEGVYLGENDFPIIIRNFQKGDIIYTSGGHKKVKKLFIDNKIPRELRKQWPIVLNKNNEIILIPHIAKRKNYLTVKPNLFVIK